MSATTLLAGVMACSLVLYVVLAGADYGAGFWDLLSGGAQQDEQKDLIANAIRPIWEANHVWLILIFVLLFAGFPRAFGAIMIALYAPILLMLLGIVLRGSAFAFRAYATTRSEMQRTCAYIFSASSSVTPIFGGMVLASLSDNRVSVVLDESANGHLFNWLTWFSLSAGLFTLALCAYLAATYLAVEAPTSELRRSFRRRAFAAGVISAALAITSFVLTSNNAPDLRAGLLTSNLARFSEVVAALALVAGLFALLSDRVIFARRMVVLFAAAVTIAWAAAQYPYLARPNLTIFNSTLSENVVRDVFVASLAGALLLLPSLALLFYIFKDQRKERAIEASQRLLR